MKYGNKEVIIKLLKIMAILSIIVLALAGLFDLAWWIVFLPWVILTGLIVMGIIVKCLTPVLFTLGAFVGAICMVMFEVIFLSD